MTSSRWTAVASTVLCAALLSCATNPVTGKREFVLVSEEQEIAMGQSYAPQIASSMGLYDDEELQQYVENIAMPMAKASERPDLPWQFEVVDDPAVNAFAVPGGFIYVTRGILAHMNSEAELASVLGHEIGHVTARHSVNQLSKQQLGQIGLVVGAIALGDRAGSLLPMAAQGMQLLFLGYGRDHERQSDDLGLVYMLNAGYEPDEMVEMFRTLGRMSEAHGGARVPEWLSTHPNPANREQRIAQQIQALEAERPEQLAAATRVEREAFLRKIDGITYGADPKQGYFVGTSFHHPDLRFRLRFPDGWQTVNQPQVVAGMHPEKKAIVQLGLAQGNDAEAAARQFFSQQGIRSGPVSRMAVNGLPAAMGEFAVQQQQGELRGLALFIEHGDLLYQLLGYGTPAGFNEVQRQVRDTMTSFAVETDRRVLAAKPWTLDLVRPASDLSIEAFARTYPGPVSAEELARINQIDPGERYPRGVLAKRVVGQPLPGAQ